MLTRIEYEDFEQIDKQINGKEYADKSFLITGATGFLGKYIVHFLMYLFHRYGCEKFQIYALCRNKEKAKKIFSEYLECPSFHLIMQSVEECIQMDGALDYIFHTAGIAATGLFLENPVGVILPNVIGTNRVLELAVQKKAKGVLFFSSGAVHGKSDKEIVNLSEEDMFPLDPAKVENCYAESKRQGENLCCAYRHQYKVPAKIVRISHTYGPGIDLYDGHIYSDFVKSILKKEPLVIKGNPLDKRPFCYISDAVIAFFKIISATDSTFVYNMANMEEMYSMESLAKCLAQETFPELKLPVILNEQKRKEVGQVFIDTSRLRKLGWQPQISVKQGFERTVESFQFLRKVEGEEFEGM